MRVHIELSSRPGSAAKANEDWAGATNQVVVVLDGLTAPGGLGTGCIHGVPWFVDRLGTALLGTLSRDDLDMRTAFRSAIGSVASMHTETCNLDDPGTPSATALAARRRGDHIEWLVLADSTLIFDCTDGVKALTDDRVTKVQQKLHEAAVDPSFESDEHERRVADLVTAQRQVRNKPGGYWVAAADPAVADEVIVGAVPAATVKRMALLTDGAARLQEFGVADWRGVLDTLERRGANGLIAAVRDMEASDPDRVKWPRYKMSDDATAVYVRT